MDMALFQPLYNFVGKEKDVEEYILENIHDISKECCWGEIQRVKQQFSIKIHRGRIVADIMIWHKDGTGTAIEVKRNNTNRNDLLSSISQSLFYGMKMEGALGAMPRLVVAAPVIDIEIYNIIKKFKLPISLLMVDGERCVYVS